MTRGESAAGTDPNPYPIFEGTEKKSFNVYVDTNAPDPIMCG
jgi:hypothetical protein